MSARAGKSSPPRPDRRRELPAVERLLNDPESAALINTYGRVTVRNAYREVLDVARQWVKQGNPAPPGAELLWSAGQILEKKHSPTLRPVINATGVILNRALGTIPVSEAAQVSIAAAAGNYSTFGYDLDAGKPMVRSGDHVEGLLTEITGAEAAIVVNSLTSALYLLFSAFVRDREVLSSHADLIETDDGLRLADLIAQHGGRSVAVGSINRTTLDDYRGRITAETGLILNAYAEPFPFSVDRPALRELSALAHEQTPLIPIALFAPYATLIDPAAFGLRRAIQIRTAIRDGVDLMLCEAGYLIGAPAAGVIVGKRDRIDPLRNIPVFKAFQPDKTQLAGLIATLDHYQTATHAARIPVWQMLSADPHDLSRRAESWRDHLNSGRVVPVQSLITGDKSSGSLPGFALALSPDAPESAVRALRNGRMPVIARISRGDVLFDPRTVLPGQDEDLITAIQAARL